VDALEPATRSRRACLAGTAFAFLVGSAPLTVAGAEASEWVVIHAGQLLAVPGTPAKRQQSVVVRDGRIVDVRPGYVRSDELDRAPDDSLVVHDLSRHFVLPGFIDGHVHLTGEWSAVYKLEQVEHPAARTALKAAVYARRTLLTGITTVRDLRGESDAIFSLRDLIESGELPGPRIVAAGGMITPSGGHGDVHGYSAAVTALLRDTSAICNGADDCRRAVREQVLRGADVIKLAATGGVTSATDSGTDQLFFDDELEAIVETAHLLGRRVTAHAHGPRGIKSALRAGVDGIEHGTFVDAESVALFLERDAWLVPTLLPARVVMELAAEPGSFLPVEVRDKTAEVAPLAMQGFARAHAAGVRIAFGSDSGVGKHGDNLRELVLMVEAGMTPAEAIVAATLGGAANLGMADLLGSVETGKYADLIAIDGDPLESIRDVLDVAFVMKEGRAYKTPAARDAAR
jgi:imidazolonepropionase-like amidohydrolase